MYLQDFKSILAKNWRGSLFRVRDVYKLNKRAKEYLYRLNNLNEIKRIYRGWYWISERYKDVWEFLAKDKNFKVIIKQTAASIWNYDFVHRDIYRLAVKDESYKKALEKFAKVMGWRFEVECYDKIPYEYKTINGLNIETPESSIVSCMAEWSFIDAFAVLYFRRNEISLSKIKQLGRWKRISKTNLRVWTAVKYGCKLFNEHFDQKIFNVRSVELKQNEVKELIEETIEKVVEFA